MITMIETRVTASQPTPDEMRTWRIVGDDYYSTDELARLREHEARIDGHELTRTRGTR